MAPLMFQESFALAVQHHQAGRLAEAERLYRQLFASHPDHPDVFHMLGAVAQQTGRDDEALELIGRAIAVEPGDPAARRLSRGPS